MKLAIFSALALGLTVPAAYAQADNPPPPPAMQPGPHATRPMPPPGAEDDRRGPGHGRHHGWRHMMMMSKAAHFRIRSGDTRINVRCAEGDSTASCGQTVLQILQALQSGETGDMGSGDDSGGADDGGMLSE